MNQPRITAKITFLGASEGGRDVLPANLSSGQYRPHVVIDPNQLRAVNVDGVPKETYFSVPLVNGPAQILAGQSFLADLVLMYWPNIKYERLIPGATFYNSGGPAYCRLWSCGISSGERHNIIEGFTPKTCGQFVDRILSTAR